VNPRIKEIIDFLKTDAHHNALMEAYAELMNLVTHDDLPILIEEIRSPTSDFFVRESLALPIIRIGGVKFLPDIIYAFDLNLKENYDNDGFSAFLVELAESDQSGCQAELDKILKSKDESLKESAKWLMEFCDPEKWP
jgi:hypothetical protein